MSDPSALSEILGWSVFLLACALLAAGILAHRTKRGIDAPRQPVLREGRDAWSLAEVRRPRPAVAIPGATTGQIRAWAIARGFVVARNGAIPQMVRDAYQQAVTTGGGA